MKEARGCASRIKLEEKMNLKKIIIRENINDDTQLIYELCKK